jgi:hypothetical protein
VMVLIFFQLTYIKNYQEFWLICQGGDDRIIRSPPLTPITELIS